MTAPALKAVRAGDAAGQAFLPYGRQVIEDDDIAAVTEVLRGDYLTTGPTVARFEKALAASVGAKHAIVCANGTAALHMAARALDQVREALPSQRSERRPDLDSAGAAR